MAGTATLVARDRILTAAHTLFDEDGRARTPVDQLRFRLGADFVNEPYLDLAVARTIAVGHARVYDRETEHLDWAVLEIVPDPAAPAPAMLVDETRTLVASSQDVELVAYHRDVGGGLLRVATGCRTLAVSQTGASGATDTRELDDATSRGLVPHDCDAAPGSSGAGLFIHVDGRPRLAALHVGKIGPERAATADVANGRFNVALALGPALRRAIALEPEPRATP